MDEREAIISKFRRAAESRQGTYLSQKEFFGLSGVTLTDMLRAGFSTYGELTAAAGGMPSPNRRVSNEAMMHDLVRLTKDLGRLPTRRLYRIHGAFSYKTLEKGMGQGSWSRATEAIRSHAEQTNDFELLEVLTGLPSSRVRFEDKGARVVQRHQPESTEFVGLPGLAEFNVEAREGAADMAKYYSRLYSLERQMRSIIVQTLSDAVGPQWWNQVVPGGIREGARQIQVNEEKTGVTPRSTRPIDYTTLGELGVIVTSNWAHFSGVFKNEHAMARIMRDLNLLRVFVMHCTPLPPDEVMRLDLTISDWLRQLKSLP
jgi:hypothetical protein